MAIHPDIRDEAFSFFVQEAPELLQIIEAELLEIRQDCNTDRVHALMRAAHTIKGGSANVGLEAIKSIAHRLEDYFRCLYNSELQLDEDLERLFLEGYDCLRNPLMEAIQMGDEWHDGEAAIAAAEPIFAQLHDRLAAYVTDEDHLPSVAEMGIDIAKTIFETDVAQALERLEAMDATDPIAGAELRAQSEVFEGIAELLNLPGLTQTAHLTLAALDTYPDRTAELFPIALENFRIAQQAVLAGDRQQGGTSSIALQTFPSRDFDAQPPDESGLNTDEATTLDHGWFDASEPSAPDELWFNASDQTTFEPSWFEAEPSASDELWLDSNDETTSEPSWFEAEPSASDELWLDATEETTSDQLGFEASEVTNAAIDDPVFCDVEPFSANSEEPLSFGDLERVFSAEAANSDQENWLTPDAELADLESLFAKSPALDASSNSFDLEETQPLLIEPGTPSAFLEEPQPEEQKSIESAITAIQQDFKQLPIAAEPSVSVIETTQPEKPPTNTEVVQPLKTIPVESQVSVRLNLAQLERISNQLGELSINRNSLSLQNEQLQETLQELRRRFGQFLSIGTQLKVHLNKLIISPDRYSLLQQTTSFITIGERSRSTTMVAERVSDLSYRTNFDTLELDRYNEVYNLLQDATESIQQLDEAVEDVTLFAEQSDRGLEQQRQILTVLRDELMWARMLPLGNILNRFPRQIKDLSYRYHKPVTLKLTGTEVLVDKVVLEKLYDPLLHLLRNAFDHGIEPSDVRKRQGKPEQGKIQIRVFHRGNRTVVEIEDDGRGIDLERVRVKALETGLLTVDAAKTASSDRLLNLIFEPGFSTASQVSELSGRGVGLDIVRAQIQSLKGSITVNSQPGTGTLFTLRIPLTLSISKLLLVWSGASLTAIPSDSIEEIVNPNHTDLKTSGEQHFLHWRGQVIPIHALQDMIPFNCVLPTVAANFSFNSVPTPEEWAAPLLILRQGNQPVALQVDRLITEQELVIKPFSTTLAAPTYLYGCTILGDGSVVPVIDAVTLLLHRQGHRPAPVATTRLLEGNTPLEMAVRPIQTAPTILIVDDAATMRQMLTLTLKKAGYQVLQARDGREALEQLHQHPQIELVICDIEMPTMNGFEFLTHRRQTPALLNIPVIMLTSRSGEKHRKLAMHLGATHYFTKPYIEQQFLTHLKTVLQKDTHSSSLTQ